ncbi:MAG: hypothetical protein EA401_08735 [Planctomycetota bacterium]|nr:MAG: hypothetical protein EA401_08735 [Planctomycetota bacterium]
MLAMRYILSLTMLSVYGCCLSVLAASEHSTTTALHAPHTQGLATSLVDARTAAELPRPWGQSDFALINPSDHPTTVSEFQEDGAAIQAGKYMGWPALTLHNGSLAATVVPEIGRLVAFGPIAGGNRLWLNPTFFPHPGDGLERVDDAGDPIWRNYGGMKIWPYPWTGWPPDSDLDGGIYSVEQGDDWLLLASARSQRLDTEVSMRLQFDDDALALTLGMDSTQERAIWPVVQVPGSAYCVIPLAAHDDLAEVVSSPQVDDADLADSLIPIENAPADQGHWVSSRHVSEHRKFDVTTASGWIASVDGLRGSLRLRWTHPHPNPPDHGHDGSFYFNERKESPQKYLELECYSPIQAGAQEWVIFLDLAKDLDELSLP